MSDVISCIMPTANRRWCVPLALAWWYNQDLRGVKMEVVVVDDGDDPVDDLVPQCDIVRYIHLGRGGNPVSAKLNYGIEEARGDVLVLWADDDWHAPWRLSYQYAAILGHQVCGVDTMQFADLRDGDVWQYHHTKRRRKPPAWLAGGSLMFRREYWMERQFDEDLVVGEDTAFIRGRLESAVNCDAYNWYLGIWHGDNVSGIGSAHARAHPAQFDYVGNAFADPALFGFIGRDRWHILNQYITARNEADVAGHISPGRGHG